jgi:DNA-directed RNA polymerase specialized sigma24 family protein
MIRFQVYGPNFIHEGMTHSEISAAIGEPLGTVKSWIRGGLLRLRESLEEARS